MKPLEARLAEYRDNLLSIADQMDAVADLVSDASAASRKRAPRPDLVEADVSPLTDGAKLYRQVAGDLTVLLDGDELRRFVVTGVIPE